MNDELLAKDLVKKAPSVTVTVKAGDSYLAKRTAEEQRAIFQVAMAEQRANERQGTEQLTKFEQSHHGMPAVHGDRIYTGYDPALRMHIRGRTHRKEVMKARGLVCVFD